jgi:heme/copper-type cytochrome/quinol oxidase subunit 3
MKKAFSSGLLGLFIGSAVMLFFSWVEGIISFRLVPPRIESPEFTPQMALMLFQCLLTSAIAGSASYYTGRWGSGSVAGIIVGFGLGFFFLRQDDQPWGTIGALGMLLPLVFVGVLSGLGVAAVKMRDSISAEKTP